MQEISVQYQMKFNAVKHEQNKGHKGAEGILHLTEATKNSEMLDLKAC